MPLNVGIALILVLIMNLIIRLSICISPGLANNRNISQKGICHICQVYTSISSLNVGKTGWFDLLEGFCMQKRMVDLT